MTTKHLSDEEVQQYALNDSPGNEMHLHLAGCEKCRARVEAYRILIMGIEEQPAPVFDFDLQELVFSNIPALQRRKTSDNLQAWVFILPAALSAGLIIYLFQGYLHGFFTGISMLVVYLVAVSAIVVLTALCIDMYKTYKNKMNSLDLY